MELMESFFIYTPR